MTKTILICFIQYLLLLDCQAQDVLEKQQYGIQDKINDLSKYITSLNSSAKELEDSILKISSSDLNSSYKARTQYNITFKKYEDFTQQVNQIRVDSFALFLNQIVLNPADKNLYIKQYNNYYDKLKDIISQLWWNFASIVKMKTKIYNQADLESKFQEEFQTHVKLPQRTIRKLFNSLNEETYFLRESTNYLDGKNETLQEITRQTLNSFHVKLNNAFTEILIIESKCRLVYYEALSLQLKMNETQQICERFSDNVSSFTERCAIRQVTAIFNNKQKIEINNQYGIYIQPIVQQIEQTRSMLETQNSFVKSIQSQEKPELLFNSTLQRQVFDMIEMVYSLTNQTNEYIQNITLLNSQVNLQLKNVNINIVTEADKLIPYLNRNNIKIINEITFIKTYFTKLIVAAQQNEKMIKEIDFQLEQYENILTQKREVLYWQSLMNKIYPQFSEKAQIAFKSFQKLLEKSNKDLPQLKQNATNANQILTKLGYESLAYLKRKDWQKRISLYENEIKPALNSLPQIQLEIELDRNATRLIDDNIFKREQQIRQEEIHEAVIHVQGLIQKDPSFKLDFILSKNVTIVDFISQFQSDQQSLNNQYSKYQSYLLSFRQKECKAKSEDLSPLFQSIFSTYDYIQNCLVFSQDELELAFSLLIKFQRNNADRWGKKQKSTSHSKKYYGKIMDDFVTCPVDIDVEGNSGMDIFIQESSLAQYKIYKPLNQLRECQEGIIEQKTANLVLQLSELISKTGQKQSLGCIFKTKELENALLIQKTALSNSQEMNKLIGFLEQRFKSIKNLQMACWGKFLADSRHKRVTTVIYQEQEKAFDYLAQIKDLFSNWIQNTTFQAMSCCDICPFHAPALEFLKTRIQYQDIISIELHVTQVLKKPPRVMQIETAYARLLQTGSMNTEEVSKMFSKLYETDHQGVNYMYENQQYYLMESMLQVAQEVINKNQESKKFIDQLINKSRIVFSQKQECQEHDLEAILQPLIQFVDAWKVFEKEIKNVTKSYHTLHESNMESTLYNDQHRLLANKSLQQIQEFQSTQMNITPQQQEFFRVSQLWMHYARNGLEPLNGTQINCNSTLNVLKQSVHSLEKNKLAPLHDKVLDIQSYETYQNLYYDFGRNKIGWDRKINATLALQEAQISMASTSMKLSANNFLIDQLKFYCDSSNKQISISQRLKQIKNDLKKIVILNDTASNSQLQTSKSRLSLFIQQGIQNNESKTFTCIFNKLSDICFRYSSVDVYYSDGKASQQSYFFYSLVQYISVSPQCDYVLQNIIKTEQKLFFESQKTKEQEAALLNKSQYQQCVNELIDEIGSLSLGFLQGVIIPTFSWCLIESIEKSH